MISHSRGFSQKKVKQALKENLWQFLFLEFQQERSGGDLAHIRFLSKKCSFNKIYWHGSSSTQLSPTHKSNK